MTAKNSTLPINQKSTVSESPPLSREEAELFVLNPTGVGRNTLEKSAHVYDAGHSIFIQGHTSRFYYTEGTVVIRRSDAFGNSTLLDWSRRSNHWTRSLLQGSSQRLCIPLTPCRTTAEKRSWMKSRPRHRLCPSSFPTNGDMQGADLRLSLSICRFALALCTPDAKTSMMRGELRINACRDAICLPSERVPR